MADKAKLTDLTCPFCKEGDFDDIGLKNHLFMGQCDVLEKVPTISEEHRALLSSGRND